ncbi:hypothetical protein CBL_06123 [Carabus blaptoides fortunei]
MKRKSARVEFSKRDCSLFGPIVRRTTHRMYEVRLTLLGLSTSGRARFAVRPFVFLPLEYQVRFNKSASSLRLEQSLKEDNDWRTCRPTATAGTSYAPEDTRRSINLLPVADGCGPVFISFLFYSFSSFPFSVVVILYRTAPRPSTNTIMWKILLVTSPPARLIAPTCKIVPFSLRRVFVRSCLLTSTIKGWRKTNGKPSGNELPILEIIFVSRLFRRL